MIVQYQTKNSDEEEKPGAEGEWARHEGGGHESAARKGAPAEKHETVPAKH